MSGTRRATSRDQVPSTDRLESWKEIAAYFKRGVRTVRRWEKEEGLPVHRQFHHKLGTVYARGSELDAWRESRRPTDRTGSAGPRSSRRLMIAVLPFANLSGDAAQEYFADGLTEEVISRLGRFNPQTLGVIARTTVMRYKERRRTVRQIGAELNVQYLLEGSVRCEADRMRVTTQLVRVADQAHVWSGSYERAVRGILTLQRELAADIGREIQVKLSPAGRGRSGGSRDVDPEAYYAHLKGRHFLNAFTPDSVRRSEVWFRRAIEADPGYAPPHASLAEACERMPMWSGEPSAKWLPHALQAVQRALSLDPDLPEAYASLGLINANYLWNWPEAERHFRQALELNPGCSPARTWFAEFLAEMGRIDEALDTIDAAKAHDPLSRVVQATHAFVLLMGRRFDEAIAAAEQALEIDPDYPMSLIRLGMARLGKGQNAEAVQAFRRAERAAPGLADCIALQGFACGRAGLTQQAAARLTRLRRLATRRYVPPFLFANVYLGLGKLDRAVECIEEEYDARGWYLLLINQGLQFDAVRSDARFQALMRRMNFPA